MSIFSKAVRSQFYLISGPVFVQFDVSNVYVCYRLS